MSAGAPSAAPTTSACLLLALAEVPPQACDISSEVHASRCRAVEPGDPGRSRGRQNEAATLLQGRSGGFGRHAGAVIDDP
ncbi:hypothetical protein ACRAWF_47245 [Streptomyces sp. L7]